MTSGTDKAPQRSAQQTADHVREHMVANDRAVRELGIAITHIAPGQASATMTVTASMLNGHLTCHGGYLATLADTAFAYACNSYNEMTVASGFSIDLLAPAREGDVLSARSAEVSRSGRTGVYDCEIHNQAGARIAVFRGRSYTLRGKPAVAAD